MRPNVFAKPWIQVNRNLLSIFCCLLLVTVTWLGICLDNRSMVLAEPIDPGIVKPFSGAIASQPNVMNNLKDEIKSDLNGESNSSYNPPLRGKSGSTNEKPKPTFDSSSNDSSAKPIKDTRDEVDGQTQENLDKIQGEDTYSRHESEKFIEDVMDNIRDKVN